MYLVPRMENIVSLVLLTAVGTAIAGWVAAGSPRIAYAGLQIAARLFHVHFPGLRAGYGFRHDPEPPGRNRARHYCYFHRVSLPVAGTHFGQEGIEPPRM